MEDLARKIISTPTLVIMIPIMTIIMLPMLLCLSSFHIFRMITDSRKFEYSMMFAMYINIVWIGFLVYLIRVF